MPRHVLVAALDDGLVEARARHAALQVVRHDRARHATEECECADVAAYEVVHLVRSVSTRVSHARIEIYEQTDESRRDVGRVPGSTGVGGDGRTLAVFGATRSGAMSASATLCVAAPGSMGLMATLAGGKRTVGLPRTKRSA